MILAVGVGGGGIFPDFKEIFELVEKKLILMFIVAETGNQMIERKNLPELITMTKFLTTKQMII